MIILVTGGAGYVGSHASRMLAAAGHEVWVYDNLSLGHREAVAEGRLIEGDLHDGELIEQVLARGDEASGCRTFYLFQYHGHLW